MLRFLEIPKSINSPIDPPAPKLVTALNASLDSPVLLSMDWAKKVLDDVYQVRKFCLFLFHNPGFLVAWVPGAGGQLQHI